MEVEAAALLNDYKVFDKKFTLLKGYPGNEAHHDDKLQKHIADSRVLDCLRTLASLAPRNPDMRVQLSPSKGLFANEIIEVGELFLVPCTKGVKASDTTLDENTAVTMLDPDGKETVFALMSPPLNEEFCSSFFVVQGTANKELANVKVEIQTMTFFEPARIVDTEEGGGPVQEWAARIPCYKNHAKIAKDGEVLVYRPKQKKEGKGKSNVLNFDVPQASQPTKRQKNT